MSNLNQFLLIIRINHPSTSLLLKIDPERAPTIALMSDQTKFQLKKMYYILFIFSENPQKYEQTL